jgi:hypothetical protein
MIGRSDRSLKQSIEGLREVTTTLAAIKALLNSLIVNGERDSRELRPLLETSNITLKELRTQVLPRFYQAIGDLDGLAHSLNGLATKVSKDPSTFIRGTVTSPGPGER